MEIYNRDIAKEWYVRGREQDDYLTRFMMYWIAFNWLYNEIKDKESERDKIEEFYIKHSNCMDKYDAFSNDAIKIFQNESVTDVHSGCSYYGRHMRIKNKQSVIDLLKAFYQVRCNLFHGSKSLRCERDMKLVEAASILLGGYLSVLIGEN